MPLRTPLSLCAVFAVYPRAAGLRGPALGAAGGFAAGRFVPAGVGIAGEREFVRRAVHLGAEILADERRGAQENGRSGLLRRAAVLPRGSRERQEPLRLRGEIHAELSRNPAVFIRTAHRGNRGGAYPRGSVGGTGTAGITSSLCGIR